MSDSPKKRLRITRAKLHDNEERIKHALRDQIAEFAGLMEIMLSIIVLLGVLISAFPVIKELLGLLEVGGVDAFDAMLSHAFNLVIGIEFIKMLAKHSPGSALEVLLYAIARHMVLGRASAMDNLLGVVSIALIFIIRKYFFVPAFGATLPTGQPAPDVAAMTAAQPAPDAAAMAAAQPAPDAAAMAAEEPARGDPDQTFE